MGKRVENKHTLYNSNFSKKKSKQITSVFKLQSVLFSNIHPSVINFSNLDDFRLN